MNDLDVPTVSDPEKSWIQGVRSREVVVAESVLGRETGNLQQNGRVLGLTRGAERDVADGRSVGVAIIRQRADAQPGHRERAGARQVVADVARVGEVRRIPVPVGGAVFVEVTHYPVLEPSGADDRVRRSNSCHE